MEIFRGDIVVVNIGSASEAEPKTILALVLSHNLENREYGSIIVVPLSKEIIEDTQPYRYFLRKDKNHLEEDLDVIVHQIRTVSRERVIDRKGKIDLKEVEKIKKLVYENI